MKAARFFTWGIAFGILTLAIVAIALAIPSGEDIFSLNLSIGSDPVPDGPRPTHSVSSSPVGSYDGMANQAMLNKAYQDIFAPPITDRLGGVSRGAGASVTEKATDTLSSSPASSYLGVAIAQAAEEATRVHKDDTQNLDAETTQIQPLFLVLLGFGLIGSALWAWNRHNKVKSKRFAVRRI